VGVLLSQVFIIKKQMKHILNNLSNEEKNSIREQHTGGMNVMTENFSKLMNSKLGDSKPLVSEEEKDNKTADFISDIKKELNRKVASVSFGEKKDKFETKEKTLKQLIRDIEDIIKKYK
jgi:DNA-binding ferritin-like protein